MAGLDGLPVSLYDVSAFVGPPQIEFLLLVVGNGVKELLGPNDLRSSESMRKYNADRYQFLWAAQGHEGGFLQKEAERFPKNMFPSPKGDLSSGSGRKTFLIEHAWVCKHSMTTFWSNWFLPASQAPTFQRGPFSSSRSSLLTTQPYTAGSMKPTRRAWTGISPTRNGPGMSSMPWSSSLVWWSTLTEIVFEAFGRKLECPRGPRVMNSSV